MNEIVLFHTRLPEVNSTCNSAAEIFRMHLCVKGEFGSGGYVTVSSDNTRSKHIDIGVIYDKTSCRRYIGVFVESDVPELPQ